MNIPNIISLARLLMVPFTIWLIISEAYGVALACFAVAGISDAVDGYLARRMNQRSELGTYLDPLADKMLLVSVYVTLGMAKLIPAWLVILVVSRDVLIVGAVLLSRLMDQPIKVEPLMVSKINTVAQIALAVLVLAAAALHHDMGRFEPAGMLGVGALTIASGGAYLLQWFRHIAGEDGKGTP